MHNVTDRQTDGRHDANSQAYCVAVRSAKNMQKRPIVNY